MTEHPRIGCRRAVGVAVGITVSSRSPIGYRRAAATSVPDGRSSRRVARLRNGVAHLKGPRARSSEGGAWCCHRRPTRSRAASWYRCAPEGEAAAATSTPSTIRRLRVEHEAMPGSRVASCNVTNASGPGRRARSRTGRGGLARVCAWSLTNEGRSPRSPLRALSVFRCWARCGLTFPRNRTRSAVPAGRPFEARTLAGFKVLAGLATLLQDGSGRPSRRQSRMPRSGPPRRRRSRW